MRKKNTTVSEAEIMKFVKNQDEAWQRQFVARQVRRNDPANAERLEKVRSRLEAMRASWETMRDKIKVTPGYGELSKKFNEKYAIAFHEHCNK